MTISSMTGFARQSGTAVLQEEAFDWIWEIKSVNGKSLEIKMKMPNGYESRMAELRNIAARFLVRGNVAAYLEVKQQNEQPTVKINEDLLAQVTQTAIALFKKNADWLDKPSASELLNLRGVLECEEKTLSEENEECLWQKIAQSFAEVCGQLQKDRQAEGAKIKTALENILSQIKTTVDEIEQIAVTLPLKMKEKLNEQVKQWAEGVEVSEDRLAQELVLYVTRADIREEVDRLHAHIKTAQNLLNEDGGVGRRLDFLCQELNREANTTCSKSCDIELTNLGMKLKALIEQFREQVQNIE